MAEATRPRTQAERETRCRFLSALVRYRSQELLIGIVRFHLEWQLRGSSPWLLKAEFGRLPTDRFDPAQIAGEWRALVVSRRAALSALLAESVVYGRVSSL